MKQLLLTNWTLWRILRFALAIVFIAQGALKADYMLLGGGIFLLIHALLNVCSSCATGNCEMPKK